LNGSNSTTAGVNRHSVCYQHLDFSTKVLERSVPNITADRWFAYIATVDDDDWQDELASRRRSEAEPAHPDVQADGRKVAPLRAHQLQPNADGRRSPNDGAKRNAQL
jgi:hypothetical protein